MLKRVILVLAVIVAGFLTGYYSEAIYDLIWPEKGLQAVGPGSVKKSSDTGENKSITGQSSDYISKGDAINAVKNFPVVEKLARVSELDGTQLIFEVDQEPTEEFPVWLVEIKERHPDKIPESRYFQVDAVTGKVLDLQTDELEISGIGLFMTKREVEAALGRPPKSSRVYDKDMKQTVRVSDYKGLEIVFDSKGGIIRLTADDPEHTGPRGIKVGDSKKDAIRMFGKAGGVPTKALVYNPAGDEQVKFSIKLDSDDKIVEVSIENGQ